MAKKMHALNLREKLALIEWLKNGRCETKEDGFAVYLVPYSEVKLAEQASKDLGFHISPSNLIGVRAYVFGKIKPTPGRTQGALPFDAELKQMVGIHQRGIVDLVGRMSYVENELAHGAGRFLNLENRLEKLEAVLKDLM